MRGFGKDQAPAMRYEGSTLAMRFWFLLSPCSLNRVPPVAVFLLCVPPVAVFLLPPCSSCRRVPPAAFPPVPVFLLPPCSCRRVPPAAVLPSFPLSPCRVSSPVFPPSPCPRVPPVLPAAVFLLSPCPFPCVPPVAVFLLPPRSSTESRAVGVPSESPMEPAGS
nr:proline-rich protein 36-like [Penaeus vannamei]